MKTNKENDFKPKLEKMLDFCKEKMVEIDFQRKLIQFRKFSEEKFKKFEW